MRFVEVIGNRTEHLKAIFVDVSYPNELENMAATSRNLTPQRLDSELLKLKREANGGSIGGFRSLPDLRRCGLGRHRAS